MKKVKRGRNRDGEDVDPMARPPSSRCMWSTVALEDLVARADAAIAEHQRAGVTLSALEVEVGGQVVRLSLEVDRDRPSQPEIPAAVGELRKRLRRLQEEASRNLQGPNGGSSSGGSRRWSERASGRETTSGNRSTPEPKGDRGRGTSRNGRQEASGSRGREEVAA